MTLRIRLVISIALLMVIAPACSVTFGILATSSIAYLIGGKDYVELIFRPHETTEYEAIIFITGLFSVITGILIGVLLWRWLMKKTGLVPLDYIDKRYGR